MLYPDMGSATVKMPQEPVLLYLAPAHKGGWGRRVPWWAPPHLPDPVPRVELGSPVSDNKIPGHPAVLPRSPTHLSNIKQCMV